MALTSDELQALVARCDALKPVSMRSTSRGERSTRGGSSSAGTCTSSSSTREGRDGPASRGHARCSSSRSPPARRLAPRMPGAGAARGVATVRLHGRVVLDGSSSPAGVVPAVLRSLATPRQLQLPPLPRRRRVRACRPARPGSRRRRTRPGSHCGACHDGKGRSATGAGLRGVLRAGRAPTRRRAAHAATPGPNPAPRAEYAFVRGAAAPSRRGYVDWEAAERRRLVKPIDIVDGVSVAAPGDEDRPGRRDPGARELDERRHLLAPQARAWNGCELCHPEIFPVTRRGSVRFDMDEMRAGAVLRRLPPERRVPARDLRAVPRGGGPQGRPVVTRAARAPEGTPAVRCPRSRLLLLYRGRPRNAQGRVGVEDGGLEYGRRRMSQ